MQKMKVTRNFFNIYQSILRIKREVKNKGIKSKVKSVRRRPNARANGASHLSDRKFQAAKKTAASKVVRAAVENRKA